MDDLVLKAILKWPHVPSCVGWLGLDERGDWYMRDERTQALGGFKSGCVAGNKAIKGVKLVHGNLIAFIGRNYTYEWTATGQQVWYFQNGPQKVYVDLACTPYIWRLEQTLEGIGITAHTGLKAYYQKCQLDVKGRVYLQTTLGMGLVHTMDVHLVAEAIEKGHWAIDPEAFKLD